MTRKQITKEQKEEIIKMTRAGMPVMKISAELEIGGVTVYRVLSEAGVRPARRRASGTFGKLSDEQIEELIERYNTDEPVLNLLDEYRLTHTRFYQLLRHMEVEPRTRRASSVGARELQLEHALKLYQTTDLTIAEIVAETGVHQPVINQEVRLRGLRQRKPRLKYDVPPTDAPESPDPVDTDDAQI